LGGRSCQAELDGQAGSGRDKEAGLQAAHRQARIRRRQPGRSRQADKQPSGQAGKQGGRQSQTGRQVAQGGSAR
jgi:hypothetical protein